MNIAFKNIIDMRTFEARVENLNTEEFKKVILGFEGQRVDEIAGRTEKFDFENIGSFHEDTVENYLRELSSIKNIKEDKILELLKEIKSGDTFAREVLMEGMLKRVAKIALQYSKVGTSYIELVQDGLMGIVEAVENYDLDSTMNFVEYMEYWIKYIMIMSNKEVVEELKSPISTYFKHMKVTVYRKQCNDPTEEVNPEDVKKILNMDMDEYDNLEKVNDYGFLIKEEDRAELKTYTDISDVDYELEKLDNLMSVANLGNKFTTTEIEILDLYYGLSGKRKYFEDIAKLFDMEANKVKTVVSKLMIKLKYNGKKVWINEN